MMSIQSVDSLSTADADGADAIEDASHRDDLVLYLFGGAGTALIAAAQTGRLSELRQRPLPNP